MGKESHNKRSVKIKHEPYELNSPQFGEKAQVALAHSNQLPSLINEDVALPVAVLKASALTNNLDWMQRFAKQHQVKLAPHGKTSMTPAIFQQQLDHGAWGITVATPAQAQIAAAAGAQNIILANQLVGRANMALIAELITQYGLDFYCCVDSPRNANALNQFFAQQNVPLNVLIELGVVGGRCGCRTAEQVFELAQVIANLPYLRLAGIEVYEGVIGGEQAEHNIRQFLNKTLQLAEQLVQDELLPARPIVTGAGSAWYDVVAESLAHLTTVVAVIRPGCYAIHDQGIYQVAQNNVMQRAINNQGAACDLGGDLQSSLELWAYVQSRPEPESIIVGLGKRDAAFDAGLPNALRVYRDGELLTSDAKQQWKMTTVALMDQHAMLTIDADSDLQVGDIVVFSTSHPCLTIDKWRSLAICNDQYRVLRWFDTYF